MDTVTATEPAYGTVDYYATRLRCIAADNDSYEAWLITEGTALDLVRNAADAQGDSDTRRLTEVRNILAALALVKAERAARLGR